MRASVTAHVHLGRDHKSTTGNRCGLMSFDREERESLVTLRRDRPAGNLH
jgi:hypothetical protein